MRTHTLGNALKAAFLGLSLLLLNTASADDYYSRVDTRSAESLRDSLNQIIRFHKRMRYGDAWHILPQANPDPSNRNNVQLFYLQKGIPKNHRASGRDNRREDYWNREHVWPQGKGLKNTSARTDLHNLLPTDKSVNHSRANKAFDNGGSQHHECRHCQSDGNSWQPGDSVKGDIARIMFYMDVRYEGGDSSGAKDLRLVETENGGRHTMGVLSTLKQWHCDDPVSDYERRRNDVIFQHQENRNPFIDHPEWAEKVFGFQCP